MLLLPHRSQQPAEPFCFTGARGISDGCLLNAPLYTYPNATGIGFLPVFYIYNSYLLIVYLHRYIPMEIYRYAYMRLCHDAGMSLYIGITIYVYTDIITLIYSYILMSNCLDLIRQGVNVLLYLSLILIPTFNPKFFMDYSIRSSL